MPHISSALQMQVLRDYGMEHVSPAGTKLDYLITPELGGLADRRNLSPPYGLRSWNAHAKDVLENRLPQLVCSGEIDVATAQREIASNWIHAYRKYLTSEPAIQLHARVLELPHSRSPIGDCSQGGGSEQQDPPYVTRHVGGVLFSKTRHCVGTLSPMPTPPTAGSRRGTCRRPAPPAATAAST